MSLDIVYSRSIPGGLPSGRRIVIQGRTRLSTRKFGFRLTAGTGQVSDDVLLFLEIRFDERAIVKNSYIGGRWGQEERAHLASPFPDRRFTLTVVHEASGFQILLDGSPITDFRHRTDPNRVQHLIVDGDVNVDDVSFDSNHTSQYPGAPYSAGPTAPLYPSVPGAVPPVGFNTEPAGYPMPGGPGYPMGGPGYPTGAGPGYPMSSSPNPVYPSNPGYPPAGSMYPPPAAPGPYPPQPAGQYPPQPGSYGAGYPPPAPGYPGAPPPPGGYPGAGYPGPPGGVYAPQQPPGHGGHSGAGLGAMLTGAAAAVGLGSVAKGVLGSGHGGHSGGKGGLTGAISAGAAALGLGGHHHAPGMPGKSHGMGMGMGPMGAIGAGAAAAVLGPKLLKKNKKHKKNKMLKYGLPAAALGGGAYAMHRGFHKGSSSSSSSSSSGSEEE